VSAGCFTALTETSSRIKPPCQGIRPDHPKLYHALWRKDKRLFGFDVARRILNYTETLGTLSSADFGQRLFNEYSKVHRRYSSDFNSAVLRDRTATSLK
jgi:hypothetical protein